MAVAIENLDDVQVIVLAERIDSSNAVETEAAVRRALDAGPKILLDMEELVYVSSAGLRVVLLAAKQMRSVGGKIAVCGVAGNVRQVFEISGFLSLFSVYPDRLAALTALRT
ncbi:MAG TPA: STAS domain-containing protein [Devosiaceae bacterium]|nr:STAS domain-containing protein [Devosiaceae bacterium]